MVIHAVLFTHMLFLFKLIETPKEDGSVLLVILLLNQKELPELYELFLGQTNGRTK